MVIVDGIGIFYFFFPLSVDINRNIFQYWNSLNAGTVRPGLNERRGAKFDFSPITFEIILLCFTF